MSRLPAPIARHARGLLPPIDHVAYREGVKAMTPLAVAIAVWGVVTGVAIVNAGLPIGAALLMTFTVFAGSAQLAVMPLLATGVPLPIVWVTALLVNLRFVIFAAASRRSFMHLPWRQRLLASYLNGDLGFALFSRRFADSALDEAAQQGNPEQWGYFYGVAVVNWAVWQAGSVAGFLIGGLMPTDWGFELAAYIALLALLIPMVQRMPAIAGVVGTATVAVLTVGWPMRLGLLLAVLVGVTIALLGEAWRDGRVSQS
ncbi:MAG: AzlC family ABC transporter permease [Actinobacteria bacterium]|nr:AzlC family ABC transporter permease [Actinomycetota bacterium]